MSHVATVDVEIKDLDALAIACKALGLELVRDQNTYRWYGQHVGDYPLPEGFTREDLGKCDHAIRIIGGAEIPITEVGQERPYEIGVVRRRDGRPGFCLQWDFFAGGYGLKSKVGDGCKQLKQQYAVAVSRLTLQRKGYRLVQTAGPNGAVVLRAMK